MGNHNQNQNQNRIQGQQSQQPPKVSLPTGGQPQAAPQAKAQEEDSGDEQPNPIGQQSSAALPSVKAAPAPDDLVSIVVLEDVEPSPRIGHYDCAREIGPKMVKTKTYRVPRHVAEVFVDRKKGQIIG